MGIPEWDRFQEQGHRGFQLPKYKCICSTICPACQPSWPRGIGKRELGLSRHSRLPTSCDSKSGLRWIVHSQTDVLRWDTMAAVRLDPWLLSSRAAGVWSPSWKWRPSHVGPGQVNSVWLQLYDGCTWLDLRALHSQPCSCETKRRRQKVHISNPAFYEGFGSLLSAEGLLPRPSAAPTMLPRHVAEKHSFSWQT